MVSQKSAHSLLCLPKRYHSKMCNLKTDTFCPLFRQNLGCSCSLSFTRWRHCFVSYFTFSSFRHIHYCHFRVFSCSLMRTSTSPVFVCVCVSVCRLDPALIRPGRVDIKAKVDYCTTYQLQTMFERFYPEESKQHAREFAQTVLASVQTISPAEIQGYFMLHKDSGRDALANAANILNNR